MTTNLVILPSSSAEHLPDYCVTPPPGQGHLRKTVAYDDRVIPNSSSSDLPSPSDIFCHRVDAQLRGVSKIPHAPEDHTAGSQTVTAGLLERNRLSVAHGLEQNGRELSAQIRQETAKDTVEIIDNHVRIIDQVILVDESALRKKPVRAAKADGSVVPKKPRRKIADKKASLDEKAVERVELCAGELSVAIPSKKRKRKPVEVSAPVCGENADICHVDSEVKKAKAVRKPRKKTGVTSAHFDAGQGSSNQLAKAMPETSSRKASDVYDVTVSSPRQLVQESPMAAARRRRDWTPVKETGIFSGQQETCSPSKDVNSPSPLEREFTCLIENFVYDKAPGRVTSIDTGSKSAPNGAMVKRQMIQPMVLAVPSAAETCIAMPPEVSPTRKSPKKKPFSITNLVTERYTLPAERSIESQKASTFFAKPPVPTEIAEQGKTPQPITQEKGRKRQTKPRISRSKADGSTKETPGPGSKKKVAKSKQVVKVRPNLLSPTLAAREANGQNLLFGTSSQLITGDSPIFLRSLQQAYRDSEAESITRERPESPLRFKSRVGRARSRSGGGLWREAARLLSDDVPTNGASDALFVDSGGFDSVSTGVAETLAVISNDASLAGEHEDAVIQNGWNDFAVCDQSLSPAMDQQYTLSPNNDISQTDWKVISSDSPVPATAHWRDDVEILETGATEGESKKTDDYIPVPSEMVIPQETLLNMTDSTTPSAAQRFKHLSSPGLPPLSSILGVLPRPVISRPLQADRAALRTLSTNAKKIVPADTDASTKVMKKTTKSKEIKMTSRKSKQKVALEQGPLPEKRPRGRPKKIVKDSLAAGGAESGSLLKTTPTKAAINAEAGNVWKHIDEIEDSEPDMTPSPPRRERPTKSSTQSIPNTLPTETVSKRVPVLANASHPRWPDIQILLYPQITDAIQSLQPSTDITKPNWLEKMLLYDPIVIEDLTAWLNHERGLRILVGEKEEFVKGWMVQKWCEEKSVCCLWRLGLRGGVKTKY